MARITEADAQGWVEGTKFTIQVPFSVTAAEQLSQIETEVLGRVSAAYPAATVATWVDELTTPELVKVAIAKLFVAWMYRKQYSESIVDTDASYAALLEANAETIIMGLADGTIPIPGVTSNIGPVFYPTDASSAMSPTRDDPSLGPAKFSMGMVF